VASDLPDIINRHPVELAALLRPQCAEAKDKCLIGR
jgi:hypothetical protein